LILHAIEPLLATLFSLFRQRRCAAIIIALRWHFRHFASAFAKILLPTLAAEIFSPMPAPFSPDSRRR
jgi:hypothetical protein